VWKNFGPGKEYPIGLVILGRLVTSTALSLFAIPVAFRIVSKGVTFSRDSRRDGLGAGEAAAQLR
jgi:Cu/Ag efflux pump CusA